jgi:pSer/pThr/pTyr-binding forkhead associated (FHA) protein
LIRDLNSTNGTFINGERVSEKILKPGQILRLGQIEMRLETETTPAPASKKPVDQTLVMQRGVSLTDLEQGARAAGFDTASKGFSKKEDSVSKIFWIAAGVFGLLIVALLFYVFMIAGGGTK